MLSLSLRPSSPHSLACKLALLQRFHSLTSHPRLIHFTGDFKYTSFAGMPFVVLGTALLIHFRTPSTHVGLLVMCQVMMGIGTGIFATCAQLAIMASVTHQELAIAVALWGMFGSIGSSIGTSIAGAL